MFSWGNFYLSSIQQGIQAGHAWVDMAVKYFYPSHGTAYQRDMFWEWARDCKVVNVRNGGEQEALRSILGLFDSKDNPYPWVEFREDQGLNYALTNVSIVLPEKVYAYEPEIKVGNDGEVIQPKDLTKFELEVYNLIKSTRLAI